MSTAPAPARPARLSDEERRHQLLQYGRRHFAEHGFDSMPMAEIARRAGVSKGLLYHYFGGRRGFYVATVEDVVQGLLDAMANNDVEPSTPLEAVSALVDGFVGYVLDNGAIYQALVRGGLGADPEVGGQLDRVREFAIAAVTAPYGLRVSSLQRLQLAGWIAWVETATSAWLDADDVDTAAFVDVVVRSLGLGVAAVFAEASS